MLHYSKDRVTARTILDTRRQKAGGGYPVKIVVTYNRKVKQYRIGKEVTPEVWASLPTARSRAMVELREDIEGSFGVVRDYIKQLTNEGDFSFEAFNTRLLGATASTVNVAIQQKVKNLKENGQHGTAQIYAGMLRTLERYAGSEIEYADITPKWLRGYERYEQGRGMKQTTIAINLRSLKAVINDAMAIGVVKQNAYPFGRGKFEIREGEGRKLALSVSQIKQIAEYEGQKTIERYRDYWLFMYLCNGINPKDMTLLKWSNVENGEICFVRQKTRRTTKTEKTIRAIITPRMQDIIDRRGNKPSATGYIFPILNRFLKNPERIRAKQGYFIYTINMYMRKLGEILGIGRITTYTARHSFATVLKRSGANIAYISESLGHTDLKTTENYLASFEREEREKNALLLEQF